MNRESHLATSPRAGKSNNFRRISWQGIKDSSSSSSNDDIIKQPLTLPEAICVESLSSMKMDSKNEDEDSPQKRIDRLIRDRPPRRKLTRRRPARRGLDTPPSCPSVDYHRDESSNSTPVIVQRTSSSKSSPAHMQCQANITLLKEEEQEVVAVKEKQEQEDGDNEEDISCDPSRVSSTSSQITSASSRSLLEAVTRGIHRAFLEDLDEILEISKHLSFDEECKEEDWEETGRAAPSLVATSTDCSNVTVPQHDQSLRSLSPIHLPPIPKPIPLMHASDPIILPSRRPSDFDFDKIEDEDGHHHHHHDSLKSMDRPILCPIRQRTKSNVLL